MRLVYTPAPGTKAGGTAEVTIIWATGKDGSFEVEEPRPAGKPGEWIVPPEPALFAIAFGPRGLDRGKVEKRVEKNPELVGQLADYAERTGRTEALVSRLLAPAARNPAMSWDVLLSGVAAQTSSGKRLDRSASPQQQTLDLLRGLNPALSNYDPLAPASSARLQQSAGLATAVAAMFFGNPVGLTTGGAALFLNVKNLLFPKCEFRSSLLQRAEGESQFLCGSHPDGSSRGPVAYLWAMRVPASDPPRMKLLSSTFIAKGTVARLPLALDPDALNRMMSIREWDLVSPTGTRQRAPARFMPEARALEVNLSGATVATGEWRIEGVWDWEGAPVEGRLFVVPEVPAIARIPLRVHLGEFAQKVTLSGSGLDRIAKLECAKAAFAAAGQGDKQREFIASLAEDAQPGETLDLKMTVEGAGEPLTVPDAIVVAGPRPRIDSVSAALPDGLGVSLREGELPFASFVSFALKVSHAGQTPVARLLCSGAPPFGIRIGEQHPAARLVATTPGTLFLTVEPAGAGLAGCEAIIIVESETGRSDPWPLGKVVQLPRIESFRLSEERLAGGRFAGVVEGWRLETLEKVGWNDTEGVLVEGLPEPLPGKEHRQRLRLAVDWPAPAPHAPLYVWLRGESHGRRTDARY